MYICVFFYKTQRPINNLYFTMCALKKSKIRFPKKQQIKAEKRNTTKDVLSHPLIVKNAQMTTAFDELYKFDSKS